MYYSLPSQPSASSRPKRLPRWRYSCAAAKLPRSPAPISAWTGAGRLPRLARMRWVIPLLATLVAACSVIEQPAAMIPRWTAAWREAATANDEKRLREWRTTFVAALAKARQAGHSAEIDREGALLDP